MFADNRGELLTVAEVALRLGVSASSVRRKIAAGELATIRLGDGIAPPIRVAARDLDAYLDAHRRPGVPA